MTLTAPKSERLVPAGLGHRLTDQRGAEPTGVGAKPAKAARPACVDPQTGITWQQQGPGRNWKDGIPPWPWARARQAEASPNEARRTWTDPEAEITWHQPRRRKPWKDGMPPWERRARAKLERLKT